MDTPAPTPDDEPRTPEAGRDDDRPRRLRPAMRGLLTALLLSSAVGAVAYHGLERGHLARGSAMFLGLPMLIGLSMIHLVHTRSTLGRSMQGNLIFLALVAPLLGEASLCIIMAMPLFLAAGAVLSVTVTSLARSHDGIARRRAWILALPLGLGLAEEHVLTPEPLVIETVRELPGDLDAWRAAVRTPAPPSTRHTWWTAVGFPVPTDYTDLGEHRVRVDFTPVEGWDGHWVVRSHPSPHGVRFLMERDTTKLARWIDVHSSSVDVLPGEDGTVRVRQITVATPLLGPHLWFDWLMGHALRDAHVTAAHTWAAAVAARDVEAP